MTGRCVAKVIEPPLAGGEVTELIAAHAQCLAACALAEGDLTTAAKELQTAAGLARLAPPTVLMPLVPLGPLVQAVGGDDPLDPAELISELRALGLALGRPLAAMLDAADCVRLGRAGQAEAATTAVEGARREVSGNGFVFAVVSWLLASAAARDGWGQPVTWLAEALQHFEARRLRGPADACRAALRGLGHSVASGQGELNPREQDVLALVAEGLPNRSIADRLYLSPRTVEKHVERLLAKTGTANRAQLAAYALRRHSSASVPPGGGAMP